MCHELRVCSEYSAWPHWQSAFNGPKYEFEQDGYDYSIGTSEHGEKPNSTDFVIPPFR